MDWEYLSDRLVKEHQYRPVCQGRDIDLLLVGESHHIPLFQAVQEDIVKRIRPTDFLHEFSCSGTYYPQRKIFLNFATGSDEDWKKKPVATERCGTLDYDFRWLAHKYGINVSGFDANQEELANIYDRVEKGHRHLESYLLDPTVNADREKLMGPRLVKVVRSAEGFCVGVIGAYHLRIGSGIHQCLRDTGIEYAIVDQTNKYYHCDVIGDIGE